MNRGKIEILAPAGSPGALTAAVRCGADAVYLGVGRFNARQAAHNFAPEDMPETVLSGSIPIPENGAGQPTTENFPGGQVNTTTARLSISVSPA